MANVGQNICHLHVTKLAKGWQVRLHFEPFEFLSHANIVFAILYIHVYNLSLQHKTQHSHTDRLTNTRIVHANEKFPVRNGYTK